MGYRLLSTRILTFSSHHADMERPACSGVDSTVRCPADCFGDSSFAAALLRRTEALRRNDPAPNCPALIRRELALNKCGASKPPTVQGAKYLEILPFAQNDPVRINDTSRYFSLVRGVFCWVFVVFEVDFWAGLFK